MPVKRRKAKQRFSEADELAAWEGLFDCGFDFFGDLEPFGFDGRDYDRAAQAAAGEAWHRLGAAFMATWVPRELRAEPWALEEFGPPKGKTNAR